MLDFPALGQSENFGRLLDRMAKNKHVFLPKVVTGLGPAHEESPHLIVAAVSQGS